MFKDRRFPRMAEDAADHPVRVELELNLDNMRSFLGFLKYIRAAAGAGHGSSIEADREEGAMPEFIKKFGLTGDYPKVYIDGDGPDRIGRILVNGEELK